MNKENYKLKFFNPLDLYQYLLKLGYIKFFIIGSSSVFINLFLTWLLTEFIFGLNYYFYGYLIGLSASLIYNFFLQTIITFKTKKNHSARFIIFIIYNLFISFIQAFFIKIFVPIIGVKYYLLIIGIIIFIFSFLTFLFFKLWLFKEK